MPHSVENIFETGSRSLFCDVLGHFYPNYNLFGIPRRLAASAAESKDKEQDLSAHLETPSRPSADDEPVPGNVPQDLSAASAAFLAKYDSLLQASEQKVQQSQADNEELLSAASDVSICLKDPITGQDMPGNDTEEAGRAYKALKTIEANLKAKVFPFLEDGVQVSQPVVPSSAAAGAEGKEEKGFAAEQYLALQSFPKYKVACKDYPVYDIQVVARCIQRCLESPAELMIKAKHRAPAALFHLLIFGVAHPKMTEGIQQACFDLTMFLLKEPVTAYDQDTLLDGDIGHLLRMHLEQDVANGELRSSTVKLLYIIYFLTVPEKQTLARMARQDKSKTPIQHKLAFTPNIADICMSDPVSSSFFFFSLFYLFSFWFLCGVVVFLLSLCRRTSTT